MKPSSIADLDHIDGPPDAAVTLIEYADYECPFCVKAYPVIESARAAFRGKLRFVYRHIPKSADKGFTKQAAEAAEFAASKGQFWAMHAQLFMHPDQHDLESLVATATAIGLNATDCRKALIEKTFFGRVREIAVEAVKSGIIGTPTLFINGTHYQDRVEQDLLCAAVSQEIQTTQAQTA
jgi:protein-disulfide isomerase